MHPRLRQGRRTAIGVLLILAAAAVAALIFFLDDLIRAWSETYTIVGVFPEARDLAAGTPVWIAGHPVGEVERIDPLPLGSDTLARYAARLILPDERRSLVRRDSELALASARLFQSDAAVNIMPGSPAAPLLEPGDTLFARPRPGFDPVRAHADTLLAALDTLRADARVLQERIRASRPDSRRMLASLDAARAELDGLATAIQTGPLGALLVDTSLAALFADIEGAAAEIQRKAETRLTRLRDPELAAAARRVGRHTTRLRESLARLRSALSEPRGFLARLQRDPALRNALRTARAQLDSLIAESRARPWRYIF